MCRRRRSTILLALAAIVCADPIMPPKSWALSEAEPGYYCASVYVGTISAARYRIDPAQSKFIVRAFTGGFLSAFAHDHTIAIREFSGEADFTYGTVEPASLQMTIRAASLAVTDKISAKDRQKIETTMRDEVLEVSKHPEISFRSSSVSASKTAEGQYRAQIAGEITLHGVSRPLTINARLDFGDNALRAQGEFGVKQTSFGIKPPSVAGGTIKVKDELKVTFDILAHP